MNIINNFYNHSLSSYIVKISEAEKNNEHLTARIMSLALVYFALKSTIQETIATIVRIPGAIISLPVHCVLFFSPRNSIAFILTSTLADYLPTPIDLIKRAAKAMFFCIAIIIAPLFGLMHPNLNVKIHGYITTPKKPALDLPKKDATTELVKSNGFKDIVGMESVKETFSEVIDILVYSDLASFYPITAPNGVLLEGPPGCGKTFVVHKFIEEAENRLNKKIAFYPLSASSSGSSLRYQTSKNIAKIFEEASCRAEENKSISVVFIDEIDTLIAANAPEDLSLVSDAGGQERGTFLQQINEAGKRRILVIGATNHFHNLPKEIVRAGRFDYKISIPLPDLEMREKFLEESLEKLPHDSTIDCKKLAERLDGSNIARIKAILEKAARLAFRATLMAKNLNSETALIPITQEFLEKAMQSVH